MDTRTLHFWHDCSLLSRQPSKQTQSSLCCVTESRSMEGKSTLPVVIPTFTVMSKMAIPLRRNDLWMEATPLSPQMHRFKQEQMKITVSLAKVLSVPDVCKFTS